ncbi:hypothetical protein B0T25DRAFT_200613 [Lasiosphaeria hispida]|uniref:HNH nuclease domain-containing protein n=1 Tax=Lasiosphaeria hispida TaxID=260671 RepID=A0AAJ0ME44_9PEZI|nr:hypothetical protein B0T25DRAFT_200613 [Lasiosphaeria hispida]
MHGKLHLPKTFLQDQEPSPLRRCRSLFAPTNTWHRTTKSLIASHCKAHLFLPNLPHITRTNIEHRQTKPAMSDAALRERLRKRLEDKFLSFCGSTDNSEIDYQQLERFFNELPEREEVEPILSGPEIDERIELAAKIERKLAKYTPDNPDAKIGYLNNHQLCLFLVMPMSNLRSLAADLAPADSAHRGMTDLEPLVEQLCGLQATLQFFQTKVGSSTSTSAASGDDTPILSTSASSTPSSKRLASIPIAPKSRQKKARGGTKGKAKAEVESAEMESAGGSAEQIAQEPAPLQVNRDMGERDSRRKLGGNMCLIQRTNGDVDACHIIPYSFSKSEENRRRARKVFRFWAFHLLEGVDHFRISDMFAGSLGAGDEA